MIKQNNAQNYHVHIFFGYAVYTSIYEDFCVRSRDLGYTVNCVMLLLISALDICFWYQSLHIPLCLCGWQLCHTEGHCRTDDVIALITTQIETHLLPKAPLWNSHMINILIYQIHLMLFDTAHPPLHIFYIKKWKCQICSHSVTYFSLWARVHIID